MIFLFKTDADLDAMFEVRIEQMQAANRANPRTALSIAKAKALALQLKEITGEMRSRANAGLSPVSIFIKMNNALSDQIVGSVKHTFNQLGDIGGAAGDAVGRTVGSAVKASGIGSWLVLAGVAVAVVYVWKK